MKIIVTDSESIASRGLRLHLMDGYDYYCNSAHSDNGIRGQRKTNLLEVVKRKGC